MKTIIAGGRDYKLTPLDWGRLEEMNITEVVSGGASGADAGGEYWAEQHGIPVTRFPADWQLHGKAAGPIRNRGMAEYSDQAALFPGGKGTRSMFNEATRAKVEIYDFR